ncbi:beta-N-acetylglucosaminidase domain-containing protein [Mucilaginibacter boryungensis]|uniref:Beta-N-acetylglucosaminidase domain-containing protein n=1 Tax=Mucilaginibacter boryungensis TaxID=768480 RepID=A0ABR9XK72_9SPHI|nr:beta-N-acetylglucosaminidase domain-containing protein [Mucilaginibacter boryungensis]MBE9667597.1 beta-N-acetylglucosaminidase domain-containing protein [Mucilaginibacter boryungensis]
MQDSLPAIKEVPVRLPKTKNSFLEKAEMSADPTGFKIRGTKGWSWTPEQYLAEIPVLAKYKMNFMMNCYISMFSHPLPADSLWKLTTTKNEWWLPIPDAKKKAYERVFAKAREYGISFCFGVHAQLASPRPANLSSDKDFEAIWQHYAWAQSKGIHWFSVPLDDVNEKDTRISGEEHARFVNRILSRLREKDKDAQMIFCPTYYHADAKVPKEKAYLEGVAKILDKDVYVFWTGKSVLPTTITVADAEEFKSMVKHRVILWDNYPVNDAWKTLHLEPLTGRDRLLSTVVDGYMANPHFMQNDINRIPLFTIADYAYDPISYNPETSIGQAIVHQTDNIKQQQALLEFTRLYSGNIVRNVAFNQVVENAKRIMSAPFSRPVADAYIAYLKKVQLDLEREFPGQYTSAKKTFSESIRQVETDYAYKYK